MRRSGADQGRGGWSDRLLPESALGGPRVGLGLRWLTPVGFDARGILKLEAIPGQGFWEFRGPWRFRDR